MGTHKKRLVEALLMSTHNIDFCEEIKNILYGLPLIPCLYFLLGSGLHLVGSWYALCLFVFISFVLASPSSFFF